MKNRRHVTSLGVLAVLLIGGAWAASQQLHSGPNLIAAASKFLDAFPETQRSQVLLDYEMPKRTNWHYVPLPQRKGMRLGDMTESQRALARDLLRAALSQIGYDKATTIMTLESILAALEHKSPPGHRDPLKYFFAVFGQPRADGRWQVSVEGHHLSVNLVIDHGRVTTFTPSFLGANPAEVRGTPGAGPQPGTRVLAREEDLGFQLLRALPPQFKPRAIIAAKAPRDVRGGGEAQPVREPPAGVPLGELTGPPRQLLLDLVHVYLDNQPADIAAAAWDEMQQAGLEAIHFAWAGAETPGIGHYYRVQGPTFVIELCNTQPDAAGNPANHVHTLFRSFKGDFGAVAP